MMGQEREYPWWVCCICLAGLVSMVVGFIGAAVDPGSLFLGLASLGFLVVGLAGHLARKIDQRRH